MAIKIFTQCLGGHNSITPVWVPRESNGIADYYSRPNDTDDFSIDYKTFYLIQRRLGTCTIDRFADDTNHKLRRFNSKFYCPGVESVNAFACHWGGEFNWLCPPIHLIGDTIRHLRKCCARGILMVPLWTSAYYYPLIWNGSNWRGFIKNYLVVNPFYISKAHDSVFRGYATFRSIALEVDFS